MTPLMLNKKSPVNKISQICQRKSSNLELISWQEAMNLASDSQIIWRNREQPIISKKVFYYEDEEVKKKIMTPKSLS